MPATGAAGKYNPQMGASEKVAFAGSSGAELAAVLQRPAAGSPRGWALFAHCFTCTKDIFAARQIAASLAEHGIAVLRFDFTGLGESEGEFASSNFTSNVADLVRAAEYLESEHGPVSILIGHSLGGAAVLAAAERIPAARAVCTIGAPAEPAHVEHLFTERSEEIRGAGQAEVLLAGRPFVIQRQFLEDIAAVSLSEKVGNMDKALLVFHSPIDKTVGIENARRIYQAASHPKSFVSLDSADHLLTRKADAVYVASVVASWAERYLSAPAAAPAAAAGESGQVEVAEAGGTGRAQLIVNGRHELVADEPTSLGGGGAGPTPYGLLLAALGSCTSMTLRMYADRKRWPLKRAAVSLNHKQVHADDCGSCAEGAPAIDRIERRIRLEGDLDESQRQRLLAIADRCPVHATLSGRIEVVTRLEEGDG